MMTTIFKKGVTLLIFTLMLLTLAIPILADDNPYEVRVPQSDRAALEAVFTE